MQFSVPSNTMNETRWSSLLSRGAAGLLLFELVSGLVVTLGPFRASTEWSLILHTIVGFLAIAPLVWYSARHWKDYVDQAMSDVLLLGYVGIASLAICIVSGVALTGQALLGSRTSPWLRYTHLVSTLLTLAALVPHVLLGWWRRRRQETSRGAAGWLGSCAAFAVTGICVVVGLALIYSGTKYHNEFPSDYSFAFGKDRPFAPSLAHTSTNGAFDPRSLAGSETCGSSGCHTEIYEEWQTSAHRYAAMDPIFQGIQNVMAKQNSDFARRISVQQLLCSLPRVSGTW